MIRLRPYMVVVIALLLVAGPWLRSTEVSASSDEVTCACCDGPCQGCCCSPLNGSEETKPADTSHGCSCELTDFPALPSTPMEFHEVRLTDKTAEAVDVSHRTISDDVQPGLRPCVLDKSPPAVSPRPAYILFSAFLI